MKPPVYIDTDKGLEKLALRLSKQTAIAVDTESNSLFAYRERLCLVQISTRSSDYIVDPLAGIDIAQLAPVFADPGITKIFHDAEFDILMLKRTHTFEFAALFDTKVAAATLGIERVGLAAMLHDFFDVTLDKRHQRSDWGRRPLTESQLDYAARDTHYLLDMAAELREQLHRAGEPAVLELAAECRRLCAMTPAVKIFDPDEYTRIKGSDRLSDIARSVLRELFVMRHLIADRRDTPAFKVLSNDMLLAVARCQPVDRAQLSKVGTLPSKLANRYADQILDAVERARERGPLRNRRHRDSDAAMTPLERERYDALRAWRKGVAVARPTDASLVLARGAMAALARLHDVPHTADELAGTGLLEPWRVRLYGDSIVAILNRGHRS